MNCPVCKRELAPTLSICFTCGAMVNDSVREELETKIARPCVSQIPRSEIPKFEPIKPWTPEPVKVNRSVPEAPVRQTIPTPREPMTISVPVKTAAQDVERSSEPVTAHDAEEPKPKVITAKLKKETSPTLVDFQPSNPTVPDWRLQLQNSIRKRNMEPRTEHGDMLAPEVAVVTKPNAVAKPVGAIAAPAIQNEKVANAIKRIEASKRTFGSGASVGMAAAAQARARKPSPPQRSFPFGVVERKPDVEMPALPVTTPKAELSKPKLVSPVNVPTKKFDTNKLPPIPEPESPLPAELEPVSLSPEDTTEIRTKISFDRLRFWNTQQEVVAVENEQEMPDEIDDLAPFSMRFGSAVFDLIIGSFAAGIILSPLLLSSSMGTTAGLLAVFGGWLLVMFAYFTGSIAYMGRTFGMKLFFIEIIDAEANELPTFYQAAVHSAVYLLSLTLFGIGFVPAFFNEERRAMHDLLAGTLLIREY